MSSGYERYRNKVIIIIIIIVFIIIILIVIIISNLCTGKDEICPSGLWDNVICIGLKLYARMVQIL